ncbi:MAG: LON peptidase substrate-binding domain-containing protein [Acidimicrobiales bacterium]|nr:LON peptidase substrate-binding domain-containing protein [Acidimicrobiales bacterium]MCB9394542.1 LON peptidase substrate-binding domain-containing protein [Acidimicrobiaceae bacterium]
MAVMPMFPLGSVLLPGAVLPLHVFEPRYRALVQACLAADEPEFGVVLIARGNEVGGGDQRLGIGTIARMVQVAELDDGRYAVVSVGTRRIRVNAWLPDDPFPLADVDDWPDAPDPAGSDDLDASIRRLHARVRRLAALAAELGDAVADVTTDIAADPLLASYHLCALAPIGAADTYTLLGAEGAADRVSRLDAMLDDVDAVLRFRLADGTGDDDVDTP